MNFLRRPDLLRARARGLLRRVERWVGEPDAEAPAPEVRAASTAASRDVAIVGAAVRAPGSRDLDGFFASLAEPGARAQRMPEARTAWRALAGLPEPTRARLGGFLEGVDAFDPEFFGISEHEARVLDPQQRVFLDVAWEALERAGVRPDRIPGRRAGVFVGVASNDFAQWAAQLDLALDAARIPGGLVSFVATRLAYLLDISGPAVVLDAACASSHLAVHLAVQSLRAGETSLAIAGGVNVLFLSQTTELFDRAGLLSHDGRCRAYDDAGAGYFRSEGAVALVLKRLDDALRAEDEILAVIRGSAVAQDGRRRAGLVVPGVTGQVEAAKAALADAGIEPHTVGLIEAQGTATPLGDALEVKALAEVYRGATAASTALGSVKTRLGHLEAAAGAAGILAATLALQRGVIPPSGEVETPSRAIELEDTPFFLADRARAFPSSSGPRRASVHGYGMGGTNVHLVLEAWPNRRRARTQRAPERRELFVLSAPTRPALEHDVDAILSALASGRPGSLLDWCAAVARVRKPRSVRLAVLARSRDQLADRLHIFRLAGGSSTLAASQIFGPETPRPEGQLETLLGPLSPEARAEVRRWTSGRWAERVLHPALGTSAPAHLAPEDEASREAILEVLGRAFVAGADVELANFFAGAAPVDLPPATRTPRPIWPMPSEGASRSISSIPSPGSRASVASEVIEAPPSSVDASPRERRPPDVPSPRESPVISAPPEVRALEALEALLWRALERVSMRPIGACDVDASFLDLGVDSATLARFGALLEEIFGVALPRGAIFEHPTLAQLAARLRGLAAEGYEARAETLLRAPGSKGSAIPTQAPFALTPLQEAYLGAARSRGGLGGRSCQVFVHLAIGEPLDAPRLERALVRLVERHPMLGAIFSEEGTQRLGASTASVQVERLAPLDASAREARLGAIRSELLDSGADFARGPMIRAVAADLGDTFRLFVTVDLIVADLESVRIVVEEWRALYEVPERALPGLGLTFDAYLARLDAEPRRQKRARDREHHLARLGAIPPPPALPLLAAPHALTEAHFDAKEHRFDDTVFERLTALARAEGLTPAALLGAAFAETVSHFSDGGPFCLNLPVFDRRPIHPDVERMVGPFSTNLLVAAPGTSGDFFERAKRFEAEVREGLEHRDFSGVELARLIAQHRRSGLAPIAPVVFTAPLYGRPFEPWGQAVEVRSQTPHVWLDCQVIATGGGLLVRWDYVRELFHAETIATLFRDFINRLRTLSERAIPSLDGRAAGLFRGAILPSTRRATTLDGWVTRAAAEVPHQRAVVADPGALTYRALEDSANRLARALLERGLTRGDKVAILCPRGLEQIIAAVGVLRAGGAYVPVEPSQPDTRIAQILEDARPKLALIDGASGARVPSGVSVLDVRGARSGADVSRPHVEVRPDALAYVIFTSGSTGRPKGVMISHAAAMNTIEDINGRFDLGPFDRVLAFSSLGFDLSVWDLFGSFAAGATVVTLPESELKSPGRWLERVEARGVTVWSSVPTGMKMLIDFFEGRARPRRRTLRLVMLSGDWIPVDLPDRIRAFFEGARVVSLGGATEGSIWSCIYPIERVDPTWTSIPYGRAMTNQSFHVLGDDLGPVAPGEVGELFIGGEGVALGYHGDETRTRERFVEGPAGLGRLYRTGDLGRWAPSGEMEFLGRRDLQVKIRGFRVEISEIEAALRAHPAIADCAITARGPLRAERELVAHYVLRGGGPKVDKVDLLRFLRERVPEYMVPQHFVELEALPLNANGKIDRSQLS